MPGLYEVLCNVMYELLKSMIDILIQTIIKEREMVIFCKTEWNLTME